MEQLAQDGFLGLQNTLSSQPSLPSRYSELGIVYEGTTPCQSTGGLIMGGNTAMDTPQDQEIYADMIRNFQIPQLHSLLKFAGRSTNGPINELQGRAVDLLKMNATPIRMKIRELFKEQTFGNTASGVRFPTPTCTGTSSYKPCLPSTVSSLLKTQHVLPPYARTTPVYPITQVPTPGRQGASALTTSFQNTAPLSARNLQLAALSSRQLNPQSGAPVNSSWSTISSVSDLQYRQTLEGLTSLSSGSMLTVASHQPVRTSSVVTGAFPGRQVPNTLTTNVLNTVSHALPNRQGPGLAGSLGNTISKGNSFSIDTLMIKFKPLPFYEILAHVLKPRKLTSKNRDRIAHEDIFGIILSPKDIHNIQSALMKTHGGVIVDFPVQVQMRFCIADASSEQIDCFPPGLCVKVNDKVCPLLIRKPKATTRLVKPEPEKVSQPINITGLCVLSPKARNVIHIYWTDDEKNYAVEINVVRRLSASILLEKLKATGISTSYQTKLMIKQTLQQDADSEIAATNLKGSLICPLGKSKMANPCRSTTCAHLQCFDAALYLQMNEKKPKWVCPVCDKTAGFENLVIDGLFLDIINKAPSDCTEVEFNADGSWVPLLLDKESFVVGEAAAVSVTKAAASSSVSEEQSQADFIDLTSDHSDNEDEAQTTTRPAKCANSVAETSSANFHGLPPLASTMSFEQPAPSVSSFQNPPEYFTYGYSSP